MKKVYNKELKCWGMESETVLEEVESLEQFILANYLSGKKLDMSSEEMVAHFKICKDKIKKLEGDKK